MKLRVAAAACVLLLLGIAAWQLGSRRPRGSENAQVAFLGFTNTGGGFEAHFGITNPPAASISTSWARHDTNGWSTKPGGITSARRDPWGLVFAVGVSRTNDPLRFVHRFQERGTGLRRIVEKARELISKFTGNSDVFFTGRIYFVTNEVHPVGINSLPASSVQLR